MRTAGASAVYEGRRAARDLVSFRTSLEGPDGLRETVFMVDISPFGFMSRTNISFAPGDEISITLPVIGAWPARVVWSLGGRVGGEFIEPIPATLYGHLLANAPRHQPTWSDY